jgi:NDP-sugar pyrophosphorylase family protein
MILAAGLGTRLRPLTDDRPKALVRVAGRTLLEIAISRLRAAGVSEIIVNAHHYGEMILEYLIHEYLNANKNLGMRIQVSPESVLLDTGGGLKNAAEFFLEAAGNPQGPFILHNVDVLSNIDLGRMLRFHAEHSALATLAVQDRATSRYLLFDEDGQLCGRRAGREGKPELVRSACEVRALAFSGIHVLSPRIFELMKEQGTFSIIDAYLRLAAEGENVVAFRADESYWRDLGRPEDIEQAEQDIQSGLYSGA